jgi:hypothetical protein
MEPYVRVLLEHGVETCESCQGGDAHAAPEPVAMFFGAVSNLPVAPQIEHELMARRA